jgi:DNA-binding response OmpR family regulator
MSVKKPSAFVVDDETVIAVTLATILSQEGFEAEGFTNARDALKAAETAPPDFLISDVVMPELNGIELGVLFKAIYPKCRILLFSGQAATDDLIGDARKKGHGFDLLAKPVHPRELLAAIHALK